MYRIGMFSKINKVTVKTLRYYDEVGLLIPAYVDEENGYRYYTSEQLPIIHKIKALRQMGFTIDEITLIIKGIKATEIFENRKKELEKAIEESNKQASQINYYLHNLKEDFIMKYEVLVKELPEVIVYSKRMILKSYDDYFKVIPAIGNEIGDANPGMKCSVPEYCFNIYHDGEYKEKDIDIEFCEAVPKRGKDTETIKFKKIDKVDSAACVMHKGPYSTLGEAYSAVYKWIEENNYIPCDNPRESYIDGIWNKEDPEEWLTEIQVPIVSKNNL